MKIIVVAMICFLLGFGAFWWYNKYQLLLQENARLKMVEKKIPASAAEELPSPTPFDVDMKGKISGKLGYPSEGIPELNVFAFDTFNEKKYFMVQTKVNQNEFIMSDVEPGSYYLVAYASGYEASGGYTKAVPCGLSVECTDHSLIKVIVNPGETTSGVEIRDWYAAPGSFPKKPIN